MLCRWRYLATVRRATSMPISASFWAISASVSRLPAPLVFVQNLLNEHRRAIGGVEKDVQWHDHAAGQLEPLVAHGAPDGGAVEARRFGDLHARHRLQKPRVAGHQEPVLPLRNHLHDALERLVALLQRLQEDSGAVQVVLDMLAFVALQRSSPRWRRMACSK
jgi:hypothetical protein